MTDSPETHWIELRDGVGRLWGRFDARSMSLEMARSRTCVVFDLVATARFGQSIFQFVERPQVGSHGQMAEPGHDSIAE